MSCVVVIRAWAEQGGFRARAIMAAGDADPGPGDGVVTVTDSVDGLCDSLREFFIAELHTVGLANHDDG